MAASLVFGCRNTLLLLSVDSKTLFLKVIQDIQILINRSQFCIRYFIYLQTPKLRKTAKEPKDLIRISKNYKNKLNPQLVCKSRVVKVEIFNVETQTGA